jgi:hypothetical protein
MRDEANSFENSQVLGDHWATVIEMLGNLASGVFAANK